MASRSTEEWPVRRWEYIVLSLLVLTRFDYAILFFPLAIYRALTSGCLKCFWVDSWPGVSILSTWFVFSLFYFGAPFPNTFYAKMGAGYPFGEVLSRSFNYFHVMVERDPITLITILSGMVLALSSRLRCLQCLGAGLILYVVFIVKSGGGFMQGRFLATPMFLSVGLILIALADRTMFPRYTRKVFLANLLALAIILGAFTQYPFLSTPAYKNKEFVQGVADERGFYYQKYGLLSPKRKWPKVQLLPNERPSEYIRMCSGLGAASLKKIDKHIIDVCGLSDPFWARLPAIQKKHWRIGHHKRKMPTDYGDFLVGRVDNLHDESLNQMVRDVSLVSTGDIFSIDRFKSIWRLNTGHYSDLDTELYRDPDTLLPEKSTTKTIAASDIDPVTKANGYHWRGRGNILFKQNLRIKMSANSYASALALSLDHNDVYDIYVNGKMVKRIEKASKRAGLRNHTVKLPSLRSVDLVEVRAMKGDGRYSLGHLHLIPAERNVVTANK